MTQSEKPPLRFGTFHGVYIPSILTILGVIMYLRMGWLLGHIGLVGMLVIIILSSSITFLTGLSISATATNMKVETGGAYFMISRSFGLEFGAAVGLPLFIAQALGIAFYVIGFSESIAPLLPGVSIITIGLISLTLLTLIAWISADLAIKAQVFIFFIIIVSMISFFLGSAPELKSTETFFSTISFWQAFAIFFPAVTGITTGISMSGDLENPARSIPIGTILAVLTGFVIYLSIPLYISSLHLSPETLKSHPFIMKDIAIWGGAIYLGLWGASLSSGLGGLLAAPRTLQALAKDKIVPQIFSGSGKTKDPRVATIFSFIIALFGVLLGDINILAPILTMFFLTSYGVLNLGAAIESVIGNPSWRPIFQLPWYISALGAFFCFAAMFMINPGSSFIAGFITLGVYTYLRKKRIQGTWSDLRSAILLAFARFSIYGLSEIGTNSKSWRPHILVLSGSPTTRWYLIDLAHAITHGKGFLTVAAILNIDKLQAERIKKSKKSIQDFLKKQNVPALVSVTAAKEVMEKAKSLIATYGLGSLVPNTILLGETEKVGNIDKFVELIRFCYESNRNIIILRESTLKTPRSDELNLKEENSFKLFKKTPPKTIDVWWGRQRKNAGLMLAIAYMVKISPKWRDSELILRTVARGEKEKEAAENHLKDFLSSGRIPAHPIVTVCSEEEDPLNVIGKTSENSDLVFIGMRPPFPEETLQEYSNYYCQLINRTENFPQTAIVLAAEDLNFNEIFT